MPYAVLQRLVDHMTGGAGDREGLTEAQLKEHAGRLLTGIKEWLETVRRTLEASDVRRAARASGRASYRTRGRHRMSAFLTPLALRVKAPVASKRGNRFPN